VGDVVKVAMLSLFMREFILERNRLNVVFAADDLYGLEVLIHTPEFTVEANHTNVKCVVRRLVRLDI